MTTGEDFTSPSVLNVHAAFPLAASTACTSPTDRRYTTRPPATAGDDSPMPSGDALYFHFERAVGEIDREQLAGLRADIDDAVGNRRRRLDRVAGVVGPEKRQCGGSVAAVVPASGDEPGTAAMPLRGACAEIVQSNGQRTQATRDESQTARR